MKRMHEGGRAELALIGIWTSLLSGYTLYNYYSSPIINDTNLIKQSADIMKEYSEKKYEDITYKSQPFSYSLERMAIVRQDNPLRKDEINEFISMITLVQSNSTIMENSKLYSLNVGALGDNLKDYAGSARQDWLAWFGYISGVVAVSSWAGVIFGRE
jgi:hypothetical protein